MGSNRKTTFSQKQYIFLRRCSKTKNMSSWNEWRKEHPETAIQLVGADLERATLEEAHLQGADLRGANLQGASLAGADLRGANLQGVLFFEANLRNVDLQGANLWGADLSSVNLEGANSFETNLTMARLGGAKLNGILFDSKASLDHLAHPLTDEQMGSAIFKDERQSEERVILVRSNNKRRQEAQWRSVPDDIQDDTVIVRTILFDGENIQAGISILNYFGEILRQKYENKKAKVIIEQEGLQVRLIIQPENGEKEIIERALEDYITFVAGSEQVKGFLPKPMAELALKLKLELVQLELKHTKELYSIETGAVEKRTFHLKDSVDRLQNLLLDNICNNRN